MLGVAFILTVYRVVKGPTLPDRVLALDMLVGIVIGFIAVIAIRTGYTLYIDIAISLGLVGFLATIAFARFILARGVVGERPLEDGPVLRTERRRPRGQEVGRGRRRRQGQGGRRDPGRAQEMIAYGIALFTSLLIVGGALFALVAAIGINRLPDLYTRMHAASKAGTVGSGLLLLAVGLHAGDLATFSRAIAGLLLLHPDRTGFRPPARQGGAPGRIASRPCRCWTR